MIEKLQLILKDGTTINLADATYRNHFIVICENGQDFQQMCDKFTEKNLVRVQIIDDGTVLQTIAGLTLRRTQTINNPDGTITGHFYFEGGEYIQPDVEIPDDEELPESEDIPGDEAVSGIEDPANEEAPAEEV